MTRESIWLRPAPAAGTAGRPAEWSREQITAAAIAVADADGLGAVTMRRVAAELGTGSASLYRHLDARDDLLDLMVDHAFGDYDPARGTGDWRADLVAGQMQGLHFMRGRPWLVDAVLDRPPRGPNIIRILEHTLDLLAAHPAPGFAKMEAIGVLNGMIHTYLRNERPGGAGDEDFARTQTAILLRAAGDGTHPRIATMLAGFGTPPESSQDERLARILAVIIDGLLHELP